MTAKLNFKDLKTIEYALHVAIGEHLYKDNDDDEMHDYYHKQIECMKEILSKLETLEF